ncbi:MAG: ABC transporter permease [Candidatus Omnitrophica bacterium]|nr:ABC transporter permease [Candidatus Omnitrophota bacterium]
MNVIHFLVKDIFRKKLRVFLTIGGISIGISLCIVMMGIGESIKNSFKDVYGKRQIDIIIQEKEQMSILLGRVDAGLVQAAQRTPGVEDAAATLLYINKFRGAACPVFGWEPEGFLFNTVKITQGRKPSAGKKEVMAGEALMKSLQKANERQVKIKGATFSVVGAFKSSSPFEEFALVMPLADLQAAIQEEGKASFINVRLKPDYRTESAIANIMKEIDDNSPMISAARADEFIAEKTKFIVMGEQFSLLVSLITIIAVALGLANTMVTSSFEKRRFLAILLALGWQKIEIALLFICESLIVAVAGGAIGILLGFKGTGYIFGLSHINAFVPVLGVMFVLKIVAMILVSAVFAAAIPAWITLNSNPVEVIRNE